mgnify:CR=1 FL=1
MLSYKYKKGRTKPANHHTGENLEYIYLNALMLFLNQYNTTKERSQGK